MKKRHIHMYSENLALFFNIFIDELVYSCPIIVYTY